MTKLYRQHSVINRQSDSGYSDDHWLKQFEDKLLKTSVQPRGQSLYEQITSIMNTKSKYPSVQAAVDDMMQRSGLTEYLNSVKQSESNNVNVKQASSDEDQIIESLKNALKQSNFKQVGYFMGKLDGNEPSNAMDAALSFKYFHDPELKLSKIPTDKLMDFTSGYCDSVGFSPEDTAWQLNFTKNIVNKLNKKASSTSSDMPDIIQENPNIMHTLQNIIQDTRGNIPVPAIIDRLRALHSKDVANDGAWEDDKLIRLVSKLNLQAKRDNPSNYDTFYDLGRNDHSAGESDLDASNTDAFNILHPAKI